MPVTPPMTVAPATPAAPRTGLTPLTPAKSGHGACAKPDAPRLGVFGGAFNPVHRDHLKLALKAASRFALSRVLIIPNSAPPHKDTCKISYAHRRRMLELALKELCAQQIPGASRLEICDLEEDAGGLHYTCDTLAGLRARLGDDAALFFLMGADSLLSLDTWKQGLRLTELAHLVSVSRPGFKARPLPAAVGALLLHCGLGPLDTRARWQHAASKPCGHIFECDLGLTDCSSSALRAALQKPASDPEALKLLNCLPPTVYAYIKAQGLYRGN